MTGHTVILSSNAARDRAHRLVSAAPHGFTVEIKAPARTTDQNALMWKLLTEISIAKPQGIRKTPDAWKAILMHACGHAVQFETGLDGQPFPVGFRTSKLTKAQMTDLIEFIYAYAAEQGVVLTIPEERGRAA
jgi:hypothetical protein